MNINKVPKSELAGRMSRFASEMDALYPGWEACAVTGSVNMYYLTGTICDGVLYMERGGQPALWVRRSFERAALESEFDGIRPMNSFRDMASGIKSFPETLYLDMSAATLEWYALFNKHMKFSNALPVDNILLKIRSVKSPYEAEIMRKAGKTADRLLLEELPGLLREGMSEAELGADIFSLFIKNGYHGASRFLMRNADVVLGHIAFAESPLYPSMFDGASGIAGLCPAMPVMGSREAKLNSGDLVYIDCGFGMDGYHVDKTLIYSFRNPQPDYVSDVHRHCLEIEEQAASMLRPGVKPSEIYSHILEMVKPELRDCFMGMPGRAARFLGHGVGLCIDEAPVIAQGVDTPLEPGMTIAIEPKIGIKGVGMAGSENTYLVTETGAVSLTGNRKEIIQA